MTAPARVTWSARLAASLTVWLPTQRWFAGKGGRCATSVWSTVCPSVRHGRRAAPRA
ncbi:hypothetical protein ACFQ3Z_03630 [Streptomyces nogalater]